MVVGILHVWRSTRGCDGWRVSQRNDGWYKLQYGYQSVQAFLIHGVELRLATMTHRIFVAAALANSGIRNGSRYSSVYIDP